MLAAVARHAGFRYNNGRRNRCRAVHESPSQILRCQHNAWMPGYSGKKEVTSAVPYFIQQHKEQSWIMSSADRFMC